MCNRRRALELESGGQLQHKGVFVFSTQIKGRVPGDGCNVQMRRGR